MENSLNNRDFEQFVKQNADQYRMFPSEKVWKNIHNTLHSRRRWYGIGLASLLLTTATVTWVMLTPSGKKQQASIVSSPVNTKNNSVQLKSHEVIIAAAKPGNSKTSVIASPGSQQQNLFLADVTSVNNTVSPSDGDNIKNATAPVGVLVTAGTGINNPTEPVAVSVKTDQSLLQQKTTSSSNREIAALKPIITGKNTVDQPKGEDIAANENKNTAPVIHENKVEEKTKDIYPLSIESVINSYTRIRKPSRFSWLFYVTPTVSYRELIEDKEFLTAVRTASATFSSSTYADINNVVTHKPDLGMQIGFNAGYRISKKIKLTAGLQFNLSKYDIRAFSYHTEIATIVLKTGNQTTSSVSTYSNYRNFGGYKPNWLHNLFISASAPIGAELRLMGTRKKYLGIGGTVQPTYVIADKSYLISTDYQHYAEIPSLTRNWNLNTGFEIFAGYSTGNLNWRVGPQVRYQVLSSYKGEYPIQEHLFDFGLKVGLMLTK